MLRNLFRGSTPITALPDPKPLLDAMHTVALQDSPENRAKVYGEFLKSWLWICITELPQALRPGTKSLPAGVNLSVVTPNNAKGKRVLPAFTDPAALANYDPNSPHWAFPAVEVFKIALKAGVDEVVVNPFDPIRKQIRPGGTLVQREFEALAQGMIPQRTPDGKGQVLTVQKPVQIQIGRCKAPATAEFKSNVSATAAQFPELERVFRYRMRYVENGAESDVLGLVCIVKQDRFQQIASGLMASIQPLVPPCEHVDLAVLRPADLPIMDKHGELIYEKLASL